jgi:hypothetical protein
MLVEQLGNLLKQNVHGKIENPASGWALLSSPPRQQGKPF